MQIRKYNLLRHSACPPRPLCAMSGPRLYCARLLQLEASVHADAVAESLRRRDGINRGLWKGDALHEVQVVHLTQKEELMPKLAAVPNMPSGKRGAASSAAAVPKRPELKHLETTGTTAMQPKQFGAVDLSPDGGRSRQCKHNSPR